MKKILRIVTILLGISLSLIIIVAVGLTIWVSPNRLKPMLTGQVMKYTGRQLIIDGQMTWTFFPYLGVKLGHLSLGNSAGFAQQNFAEISGAIIGIKLLPLLHGAIESSGIVLDGLQLHLVKKADGQRNWNFATPSAVVAQSPQAERSTKKAKFDLAISGIDISHATITYVDEQTNKSYLLKPFEFHAKNIHLTRPFPVKITCDFMSHPLAVSGHFNLTSQIQLHFAEQKYIFQDLVIQGNLQSAGKKIKVQISGDVMTDLNQQKLEWSGLRGEIANIALEGKASVSQLTVDPIVSGHLQLEPFDLRETLKSINQDVSRLQIAKTVSGDMDFTASNKATYLRGNLNVDTLQIAKLLMNHVQLKWYFQNGLLDIAPITANLYQGSFIAEAKIKDLAALPHITLHARLNHIEAQPLIKDLSATPQKITISGVGNVEVQLATAGTDSNNLLRNLNGQGQFSFTDGAIVGLDLGYLVDTAYAVAKLEIPNVSNHDQTPFGTLTGTATIHNGIISNHDLFSDAPRFATHGSGTIDVLNQTINYTLQTTLKQRATDPKSLTSLYGVVIPVLIVGNLSSPTIRLDAHALTKAFAQQHVKQATDAAKQKIKNELKNKLNDKAADVLNKLLGN